MPPVPGGVHRTHSRTVGLCGWEPVGRPAARVSRTRASLKSREQRSASPGFATVTFARYKAADEEEIGAGHDCGVEPLGSSDGRDERFDVDPVGDVDDLAFGRAELEEPLVREAADRDKPVGG